MVEAAHNGMYATAVVGAILLAVAAYSLLTGGERSGEPKADVDSKKGLKGQQFADSREGLVLSDASGAGSGDRVPLRAYAQGRDTVIEYSDGTVEIRSGGTVSWRNNNPGNLRNYSFSQRHGSIGQAHKFAVFPNEDTGQRAMLGLLKSPQYKSRTLAEAITNWHNPRVPNLEYVANVSKLIGIAPTTPLWTLSHSQFESLAAAIRRMEGWRVGRVTYAYAP